VIGCTSTLAKALVAIVVLAGLLYTAVTIGELRADCRRDEGVLVRSTGEHWTGYVCVEKGQHPSD
jgi:hypothetical protein